MSNNPFEGWSPINEGWNPGDISTEDILANLKTVAKNFLGPVAMLLGILWGAKILITLLVGSMQIVGQVAEVPVLFTVAGFVSLLGIPIALIVGLIQSSLYRPIQLQAFEGKAFVSGVGDVVRLAKEVLAKVLITSLLFGVATAIGGLACGIGMFVPLFFFAQAPYLAATTELRPTECMRRSYELNKAYYMPVLIALAISMFVGGLVGGCGGAIVGALGGALTSINIGLGTIIGGMGADIIGAVCGSIVLISTGGLFASIQSVERNVPFKH